jgi:hypothetical protein
VPTSNLLVESCFVSSVFKKRRRFANDSSIVKKKNDNEKNRKRSAFAVIRPLKGRIASEVSMLNLLSFLVLVV